MRTKTLSFVMGMLLAASFMTSCDNHVPYDPELHVGYIVCDDHSYMDTATYFHQTARKAIGVVFAEKTEEHPVLAVSLKEIEGIFCDSTNMENGTSGDLDKFDGFTNTIAMYNSYDDETGKGSPIAMEMIAFHEYGQSDYIPSVSEQRLLQGAARAINPIMERCGGTPINLDANCWYWTSTEVTENTGVQAWLCSAANGGIMPTPKTESHKVRAIFQINYPEQQTKK